MKHIPILKHQILFFYWFRKTFKHKYICTKWHNDIIWQIHNIVITQNIYYLGAKFIITTFNINTRKVIHVIAIYKHSILLFSTFINQLEKILDLLLTCCPTVIIDDFSIDMFNQNSTQPNKVKNFMNCYSVELCFK
jgi:hypothetical protein